MPATVNEAMKQAHAEAPPPPDGGLLLGDAADLLGDPGEAAAVADQRRARHDRGLHLVEDRRGVGRMVSAACDMRSGLLRGMVLVRSSPRRLSGISV